MLRILGRALWGLCIRIPLLAVYYTAFGVTIGVTALVCWAFYEAGTSSVSKGFGDLLDALVDGPRMFFFRSGLGLILFLMTGPCLVWWLVKALALGGGFVPKDECDLGVFLPRRLSALRGNLMWLHPSFYLFLAGKISLREAWGPVDTIEEAVELVRLAKIANPNRDWVIEGRVEISTRNSSKGEKA